NREQRTENREQRTENREQRTENREQSAILMRPIRIGDGCFIGANSIILKGTELGKNCVVGAGSVVCGKFPDNVIIAGNPAKVLKENVQRKG
ncbi:MAG: acyltransferase, partial [Verrucomicrobiae bacterium]|nr:acyltransferase [Verrucomicrobiae bacterium]